MVPASRPARKAPPRSKPKTGRKPDGTTTRLSEPPQVSLYTRHAIAIARAMEFMFDHWLSFAELVPEACLDGVQEDDIARHIRRTIDDLHGYTARVAGRTERLTDATYRQEQREAAKYVGYEPVENLATIVRMAEERSKDQTPSPSQSGSSSVIRGRTGDHGASREGRGSTRARTRQPLLPMSGELVHS